MTDRTRLALLTGPALILLGGLFLGALALTLLRSLHFAPALGAVSPSLSAYADALSAPGFLRSLGLSLWIAGASTAIAAALSILAALLLRQSFPGRAAISFLVQLNLTVPHIVGAVGLAYLISQSGAFARLAHAAHLISGPQDFPALTQDPYGIGIILLYVWKELPFITLILLANLQALGEDHETVARTLGATRWQSFRFVLLPMLLPGLAAASALVFAFAFGAYEVPLLLGASAPKALPVLAWQAYTDTDLARRPEALAMAMVIAAISLALLVLYARIVRSGARDAR